MPDLPQSDADPLELYRYFPSFVKFRDSEAGTDANGEAILQKITYVLEKEAGAHSEMIRLLLHNLDPDNCALQFLDYLAFILGERIPGSWDDEKRRWFLRQLADLLKLKGLHLGFERRAAFASRHDVHAVELYKATLNETCDYVDEEDGSHPYRAARIDVAECAFCETYCQAGCEAGYVQTETMTPAEAKELVEDLGEVLPVNVLVREDCATSDPTSVLRDVEDTIGCFASCEAYCQGTCEYAEEAWPGSEVEGNFVDRLSPVVDTFVVEQECVGRCEVTCQTCCECGWEGAPCSTGCETTCQVSCEYTCQTLCMSSCQSGCQAGGCEWGCEIYSEGT